MFNGLDLILLVFTGLGLVFMLFCHKMEQRQEENRRNLAAVSGATSAQPLQPRPYAARVDSVERFAAAMGIEVPVPVASAPKYRYVRRRS